MKEIVCPECGKVLEAGVATCPNCGCPIASECPTIPCPHCGNMIAENATCPKCGGHFETAPKCGTLRIKRAKEKAPDTAPLYINGQLVEVVSLTKGCDITVPLTHSNITITYKHRTATLEHSYTLDMQKDYTIEICKGVSIGFVLYDNVGNAISKDVVNLLWVIFCMLAWPIGLCFSYNISNASPARAQVMRRLSLNAMICWAFLGAAATIVLLAVNID